jgi:DUF1680 family protein
LRVPSWAAGATLAVNADAAHSGNGGAGNGNGSAGGSVGEEQPLEPGYATVHRRFQVGDTVVLTLPVRPRWTYPHPRIDALRGTVAVERGPVVLCLESVDLGASVNDVRVDASVSPQDRPDGHTLVRAKSVHLDDASWPYGDEQDGATGEPRTVPLVPYHDWANRGPSTMRVWLPLN